MLEYLVIFAIVGWAVWYTGRNLYHEVKLGKCANCHCGVPVLIQVQVPSSNEVDVPR
jgi:hypothetical protein